MKHKTPRTAFVTSKRNLIVHQVLYIEKLRYKDTLLAFLFCMLFLYRPWAIMALGKLQILRNVCHFTIYSTPRSDIHSHELVTYVVRYHSLSLLSSIWRESYCRSLFIEISGKHVHLGCYSHNVSAVALLSSSALFKKKKQTFIQFTAVEQLFSFRF